MKHLWEQVVKKNTLLEFCELQYLYDLKTYFTQKTISLG